MTTSNQQILEVARLAAKEAGDITLQYFGPGRVTVDTKEDNTPVTIADRNAEKRIVEIIRDNFPDHEILGEEFGTQAGKENIKWIVDPIDGTKSFICGVPLYGVLIGVEIGGHVDIGVVNFPGLGTTYYAVRGDGAYRDGERISVSTVSSLEESVVLTTDIRKMLRSEEYSEWWGDLAARSKFQRTWGDCYGYMLVASGGAEIMIDPVTSPWDVAAVSVIVEEAGGVFSDLTGTSTIYGGSGIAASADIHSRILPPAHVRM